MGLCLINVDKEKVHIEFWMKKMDKMHENLVLINKTLKSIDKMQHIWRNNSFN